MVNKIIEPNFTELNTVMNCFTTVKVLIISPTFKVEVKNTC